MTLSIFAAALRAAADVLDKEKQNQSQAKKRETKVSGLKEVKKK